MKVLHINTTATGSTGNVAKDIIALLVKSGHTGMLAYTRGYATEADSLKRFGSMREVYFHAAMTRLTDRTGFFSSLSTQELLGFIDHYKPDIIHLHNLHGYYINLSVLFTYLKSVKIPVVWTLHDCWGFTGHCAYFSYVDCNKWKDGCNCCPQKNCYPASYVLDGSKDNWCKKRELFRNLENLTLVTPSKWLAGIVEQSFLREYPIYSFSNGIDLSTFYPTSSTIRNDYGLNNKKILLGVSSIWEKRKGLDRFLELASLLDDSYKLVLIGLSSKQLRQIPKNVLGIARTENRKQLAQWYTVADVFLNLSVEESQGLTTIEALACGTPVVVFDQTAVPESVTPEVGIVVNYQNINNVFDAVNKILLRGITSESCVYYATKYDAATRFASYLSLYGKIMDSIVGGVN